MKRIFIVAIEERIGAKIGAAILAEALTGAKESRDIEGFTLSESVAIDHASIIPASEHQELGRVDSALGLAEALEEMR